MVDIMIGLEIHAQLNTKSKLFCGCANKFKAEPNSLTCPVCLGMPGSKPVLNKKSIELALKVALALNCKINKTISFSRKTYFFPDLPNNYQITQYEFPVGIKGKLNNIRIKSLHIEEDPGKLIHKKDYVLIDYNRSGTPLIEIVTEPDLRSSDEAKEFLINLIKLLEYLNVYFKSGETTLRCDVNVSINQGNRVEVKNVNGIHEIKKVIDYEISRQQQQKTITETRGWNEKKQITYSMRTKESEDDYGYITEPNLTIIELDKNIILKAKQNLPEFAHDKIKHYMKNYKISKEDATVLTSNKKLSQLFEETIKKIDPRLTANWLRRDLLKLLKKSNKKLEDTKINSKHLIDLLQFYTEKKINDKIVKEIIEKLISESFDIKKYIKENNLEIISDSSHIENICQEIIENNPDVVNDYKKGNKNAVNFLIGQVMKKTKNKISPNIAKETLIKILEK